MKIIVDAMGGDNAPGAIVKGALTAARDLGVDIVLVGRREAVLNAMRSCGEAVLSHILYITGCVPERVYELGQLGRLTVLSGDAADAEAIRFDCTHYPEQLAELTI